MSYNDTIIANADATVDDEFERDMLHRSSTVAWNWTAYLIFAAGAAMAWIADGIASIASLIVLLPPLIGHIISNRWLRQRIPHPRQAATTSVDWVVIGVFIVVWIAGVAFRGYGGSLSFILGAAVGSVAGLLLVAFFLARTPKVRAADEERLAEDLED